MKNIYFAFAILVITLACKKETVVSSSEKEETEKQLDVNNGIQTLNYNQLKPWLNKNDDKTYVVNFWATWCAPCVKELPYFEKIREDYKKQNVQVILVSLDFPSKKESNLVPYVKKKSIQSKVLHFDDTNEQFWIGDIAESWSGAIPATLIYNRDKRQFYEQPFTQEELENEVKSFLN